MPLHTYVHTYYIVEAPAEPKTNISPQTISSLQTGWLHTSCPTVGRLYSLVCVLLSYMELLTLGVEGGVRRAPQADEPGDKAVKGPR